MPILSAKQRTVRLNRIYDGLMPFSEVCMHMRVAGTVMQFMLRRPTRLNGGTVYGTGRRVVQLIRNGREFSYPISTGEAGVYHRESRRKWWQFWRTAWYYYPPIEE